MSNETDEGRTTFPDVVRFMSEQDYYEKTRAEKERQDAARLEQAEPVVAAMERRFSQAALFERVMFETGVREEVLRLLLDRKPPHDHANTGIRALVDVNEWGDALVRIAAWLKEDARIRRAGLGHAPTPTLKAIYGLLAEAMEHGLLLVIVGPYGIGKTFTAEQFVGDHPRSLKAVGAVHVELKKDDMTLAQCSRAILSQLRHDSHGEGGFREIRRVLRRGDLLILDESQYLAGFANGAMIDIVRDIWRDTGAGVVLMGNPMIKKRREGIVGNDTYGAFLSRAEVHDFSSGSTRADVEAWMQWKGFSGAKLRDALVEIATRPNVGEWGGLRALDMLVARVGRAHPGEAVTSAMLSDALRIARGKR